MRIPIFVAAALAATTLPTVAAQAQSPRAEYNRDVREAQRDYRRDVRRADSPRELAQARREYQRDVREAQRDRREDRRDWRRYRNYDYNRPEPGQRHYYADRYYREGNYRPRPLTRRDRIYRGSNGRYYCRRSDGTTGLLVGGIAGGALGAALTNGNSQLLGVLLGGAAGAALGRSIDRGQVTCR